MPIKRRWPYRKKDSKRRWQARFNLGKFIPCYAVMENRELLERLKPAKFLPHRIGIVRDNVEFQITDHILPTGFAIEPEWCHGEHEIKFCSNL